MIETYFTDSITVIRESRNDLNDVTETTRSFDCRIVPSRRVINKDGGVVQSLSYDIWTSSNADILIGDRVYFGTYTGSERTWKVEDVNDGKSWTVQFKRVSV